MLLQFAGAMTEAAASPHARRVSALSGPPHFLVGRKIRGTVLAARVASSLKLHRTSHGTRRGVKALFDKPLGY